MPINTTARCTPTSIFTMLTTSMHTSAVIDKIAYKGSKNDELPHVRGCQAPNRGNQIRVSCVQKGAICTHFLRSHEHLNRMYGVVMAIHDLDHISILDSGIGSHHLPGKNAPSSGYKGDGYILYHDSPRRRTPGTLNLRHITILLSIELYSYIN